MLYFLLQILIGQRSFIPISQGFRFLIDIQELVRFYGVLHPAAITVYLFSRHQIKKQDSITLLIQLGISMKFLAAVSKLIVVVGKLRLVLDDILFHRPTFGMLKTLPAVQQSILQMRITVPQIGKREIFKDQMKLLRNGRQKGGQILILDDNICQSNVDLLNINL